MLDLPEGIVDDVFGNLSGRYGFFRMLGFLIEEDVAMEGFQGQRLVGAVGRDVDPLTDMNHFLSAYQYAGNNPVSASDPTGLFQLYQPPTTMQGPSYYNNLNNFGLPTINQMNLEIGFDDGMSGGGIAGGGGGGGMYIGGGAYQLPNGGVVDQTTAINFAMSTYGGVSPHSSANEKSRLFALKSEKALYLGKLTRL
jgi:hypothetical protein